ncbi:MAG: hypothetical protein IPK73_07980 [Candidatus Obscuribacter sp.]|nr:hypothetical protein [Candidatus Obscuribacter sp.]MBK9279539.1 hypothetical protein [Candidatus Obscuribacter sp.]
MGESPRGLESFENEYLLLTSDDAAAHFLVQGVLYFDRAREKYLKAAGSVEPFELVSLRFCEPSTAGRSRYSVSLQGRRGIHEELCIVTHFDDQSEVELCGSRVRGAVCSGAIRVCDDESPNADLANAVLSLDQSINYRNVL